MHFPDVELEEGVQGACLRGVWACLEFRDARVAALAFPRCTLPCRRRPPFPPPPLPPSPRL